MARATQRAQSFQQEVFHKSLPNPVLRQSTGCFHELHADHTKAVLVSARCTTAVTSKVVLLEECAASEFASLTVQSLTRDFLAVTVDVDGSRIGSAFSK
jgi:hypothetical protein